MTAPGSARRSNGLGLGVLAGAFTGALVIAVVWLLVVPGSDTAVPGPSPSPAATSSTPSSTPTPSAPISPSATPSGEPTPDLTAPPTENADIITELPAGSWVTVLKSLPQAGTTPEEAVQRATEFGNADHPARALDSNAFPKLKPGYWAIVIPGWASRAEAVAVCAAIGLPIGDTCYGREV